MSEEFDKEAEREKLREKLEKDEQKRQETQRMSELLLQGATMTNEHCGNCGDPLFRDGERTFCPTCGGTGDTDDVDEGKREQPERQPERQSATGQPKGQSVTGQPTGQSVTEQPEPQQRQPTRAATTPQQAGPVDDAPSTTEREPQPASTPEGDDPRAELQRAVTRSARKANAADDPRTATAWLEAATEAAEALAALEQ